jgi:hypothetical protein
MLVNRVTRQCFSRISHIGQLKVASMRTIAASLIASTALVMTCFSHRFADRFVGMHIGGVICMDYLILSMYESSN